MKNTDRKLRFNILTSKEFSVGAPLIIDEIKKRDHSVMVYSDENRPDYLTLLDCDIYFDMSSITDISFYLQFKLAYDKLVHINGKGPLLVDSPISIINAMDKMRTNKIFHDLIPKSYNLNGSNNSEVLSKLKGNVLVIKSPIGWGGKGVQRIKAKNASTLIKSYSNVILQEYIKPIDGVGRILTLNHEDDFQILCAYTRISRSWKIGLSSKYKCRLEILDKKLVDFAHSVSVRSGLYLNGIDYIRSVDNKIYLLEVNAVPAIKEPLEEFGINTPKLIIDHVERSVTANG